jgi:diguanylate cyclase (GGDEF)-like protein
VAISRLTSRGSEVRSRVTRTARQPFLLWSLLRRPAGLANQMRWFLGVTTLVSLLCTFPAALALSSPTGRCLVSPATLGLIACWGHRYHRRSAPVSVDAGEAISTGLFLAASPIPDMAFGFLFMAIWLRAMCGTTRLFIRYVAFIVTALVSGLAFWSRVPGHHGSPDWRILLILPLLVLVSIAGRYLALSLFAREQAQSRDVVLIKLGAQLLAVDSRSRVAAIGLSAAAQICACTPGLGVALLVEAGAGLAVVRQVGCSLTVPPLLTWPVAASLDHDGELTSAGNWEKEVAAAVGLHGSWRLLPIPGEACTWIRIGASGQLSPEVVGAFESLINQVGLALRNVAAFESLTAEASTDGLTGLVNRATFERRVLSALATGGPTSILYVDLDGFKAINDDLGHAAGDEVLQRIAKRLRRNVRPRDICARLGGDEFAVLLPATELAVAQDVAERLAVLLSAPITISGHSLDVGASIGVAVGGSDAAELIRAADQAMYAAKRRRREGVGPAQVAGASMTVHADA